MAETLFDLQSGKPCVITRWKSDVVAVILVGDRQEIRHVKYLRDQQGNEVQREPKPPIALPEGVKF